MVDHMECDVFTVGFKWPCVREYLPGLYWGEGMKEGDKKISLDELGKMVKNRLMKK